MTTEELNAMAVSLYSPVEDFEPATDIDHAEILLSWYVEQGFTVRKEFIKGRGKNPNYYRVTVTSNGDNISRNDASLPIAIVSAILTSEGILIDNI